MPPWDKYKSDSGPWSKYSDNTDQQQPQGFAGKAWDALAKPEQMSRQGLGMIANMVPGVEPTGNKLHDIALNIPKVGAESVAEFAPSMVSRPSLLSMGALGALKGVSAIPGIGNAASEVGGQLESLVGSPKGTLAKGYENASNFFGPGKKAAQKFYQAAEARFPSGASIFQGMYKPEEIVDKARQVLSSGGKLEPMEGLAYRKAVDNLAKTGRYVKDEIFNMRDEADAIAKGDRLVRKGDELYKSGIQNQALRRPLPLTQTGKTATVKSGAMAGAMLIPGLGKILAALYSPLVHGATATGLGALTRMNPTTMAALNSLVQQGLQRKPQLQEGQQ